MSNPDKYFGRSEVSNSDLTELKQLLHPRQQFGDKEAAFKFGTLVDALLTENDRVNYYACTVDGVQYSREEFAKGRSCERALKQEAKSDVFLSEVFYHSDTQTCMVNKGQMFEYGPLQFQLDTRCKWDWWLPSMGFGGDLKTTFAETQKQFEDAVDFFDWDRSRAWYMDIAGSDRDFIYAISKKNQKIFKKFIVRGDETYNRGREKYEELAFQWWCFNLN